MNARTPSSVFDRTVTEKELDGFYGTAPSIYERIEAINKAETAFDRDDMQMIAFENFDAINEALRDFDSWKAGRILAKDRWIVILDRAGSEIYGDNKDAVAGFVAMELINRGFV